MCRYTSSTSQIRSLCKEMAEDVGKDREGETSTIERRSSSTRKEPKKAGQRPVEGEKPQGAERRE